VLVSNGATLDLGGPSFAAQAEYLTNETIVVLGGAGVGGKGAIINSSTNSQYNALRNVMTAGDLYLGGPGAWLVTNAVNPGRWDIRGAISNCALVSSNTQPYNLYKIGSNWVGLVGVTIDSTPNYSLTNIYILGGKLQIESGTTSLGDINGNVIVTNGATLGFYQSSFTNNFTKNFVLYGSGAIPSVTNESGTTTLNGSMVLNGPCVFGIAGTVLSNNCSFSGGGSLILNGADRLVLNNASIAYTGNTTLSNGTLQLFGSIPSSPHYDISGSNAVLDVSGAGGLLAIASGQTISGSGTLRGSLTVSGTGLVAAGEPGIIGTLTVTNTVTLGGTCNLKVSHTGVAASDQLKTTATNANALALGGTLNVTLLSGTLQAGDTFTLFKAANTNGAGITGVFTTNLVNGILSVVGTINPNPTNITATVSNGVLTLTWPVDHTGWILQAETNSLSIGLTLKSNAWVTVAGSAVSNTNVMTVNPTNPAVFYRLLRPF
jgi:autotransporter-associated beta strand protein